MADYLPKFHAGQPFTAIASAAVVGGRVLIVSGEGTVAHAGADAPVASLAGVAAFDVAIGEEVTVYPLAGSVQKLTAGAAIVAGATVATAADGKVHETGTHKLAVALTPAAAADDIIEAIC